MTIVHTKTMLNTIFPRWTGIHILLEGIWKAKVGDKHQSINQSLIEDKTTSS